jgi:hypothetical protein
VRRDEVEAAARDASSSVTLNPPAGARRACGVLATAAVPFDPYIRMAKCPSGMVPGYPLTSDNYG